MTRPRLSRATMGALPADVARGDYDRAAQRQGIVHLGIGAFHRAHQAVYTDLAMDAGDRNWAITGVSLRSAQVRDQLAPQEGLYTVAVRQPDADTIRLIGAVTDVIVAPADPARASAAMADPDTRIVTITVTEKGYARGPEGEFDAAALAPDAQTLYRYLGQAVIDRHDAGLGPLTLISCDNLSHNGALLQAGLSAYLDRVSPRHRRLFDDNWACPATMVDRIVPATTPADLDSAAARIGLRDEAAVVTEPYRQWVIEDRFAGPRPRWDIAGAQFVDDVRPFETAKLRMLNGGHSALAYLGLASGHQFVHEAVADLAIRPLVERLMRDEAAASIPNFDQDLDAYADQMLARFGNPALPHRLSQIAMDGSQKIGPRWLEAIAENNRNGRESPMTLNALAGWLTYTAKFGSSLADPLAKELAESWKYAGVSGITDTLFSSGGLVSQGASLSVQQRNAIRDQLSSELQ